MTNEQRADFLSELTALTRKYNIVIGGCGCCGSPWLSTEIDTSDKRFKYACNEHGDDLDWVQIYDEANYDGSGHCYLYHDDMDLKEETK